MRTQAQVVAAKPAAAVDFCFLTGDDELHDAGHRPGDLRCRSAAEVLHASPHQVAGGPLAENILKCQLKPLDFTDYTGITFTAGAADAPGSGVPGRRLRLDQAGRRPAGPDLAADLHGRPGRRRRCRRRRSRRRSRRATRTIGGAGRSSPRSSRRGLLSSAAPRRFRLGIAPGGVDPRPKSGPERSA